ncbi:MAG TPA: hypothetical protein VNQ90_00035 [Chthoniobacteraceae bacterium]|nr:hypothetical protein [Chthoniobacteraceae bacterium]
MCMKLLFNHISLTFSALTPVNYTVQYSAIKDLSQREMVEKMAAFYVLIKQRGDLHRRYIPAFQSMERQILEIVQAQRRIDGSRQS